MVIYGDLYGNFMKLNGIQSWTMNTTMVIYCYIAATYYNYGNYGRWIAFQNPYNYDEI